MKPDFFVDSTTLVTFSSLTEFFPYPMAFTMVIAFGWVVTLLFAHLPIVIRVSLVAITLLFSYQTLITATNLSNADASAVLLDEFVAVPFVFLFVWRQFLMYPFRTGCIGLVMYSLLDGLKPFGLKAVEMAGPGALTVLADDIAAAVMASFFTYLFILIAERWK